MAAPQQSQSALVRRVLKATGIVLTAIAAAGVVLPLLPTTPLLLLAGACFVRSSPELHARMLANPTFGPYLKQWQTDRSIPRKAKYRAYVLVALTFALSIAVVPKTGLRIMLVVLGSSVLFFLWWLPTTGEERKKK